MSATALETTINNLIDSTITDILGALDVESVHCIWAEEYLYYCPIFFDLTADIPTDFTSIFAQYHQE
jgi:hypothetical protein